MFVGGDFDVFKREIAAFDLPVPVVYRAVLDARAAEVLRLHPEGRGKWIGAAIMNEDTNKSRRPIVLRRLIHCNTEQQARVREIRNQDSVRRSMYTDHIISSDEHLSWIEALKQDKKQLVFVVLNERQEAIGVVSISALDHLHRKSDWAFYLDERERGGLGAVLEYNLIEYAFGDLNLQKLNCEVLETNESVVAMHKKFFFQEEGFRRSNIEKNGTRIGVVFLGLTKADWLANKEQVISAYRPVLEKYSIAIVDE